MRGGFGMTSLRERAQPMGGHIEVRGAPGMGTRVEAIVPYQQRRWQAIDPAWASPTPDIPQDDLLREGAT